MADFEYAYHVAPTAIRDDLLAEGITPDDDDDEIWLYDSEQLADRRARIFSDRFHETPAGVADIWRVDLTGIDATYYPHINDGENVTVVRDVIEPARLALHATL